MAERNVFTEVTHEIAQEIRQAREQARKADPVPFGKVRVGVRELERMAPDSKEARQELLNRPDGRERILKLLRQRGGRDAAGR